MNNLDERLRASDPSRDVQAPDHVLATILASPGCAAVTARPRARRRRLALVAAVGLAACGAVALGIALPGGGDRGPSFLARAYAQTAPQSATDQIVHIVERSIEDVGGLHQVNTTESWQHGVRWHLKTATIETGTRTFSDSEDQLFDGEVIRSWFSKAAPQTLRATDGDEAKHVIENSRKSPLERFRAAYQDQELTDLGIVSFEGRQAHAYRTTLRDTTREDDRPALVGAVRTFYFDPQTALPLGSTLTSSVNSSLKITSVISVWEHLAPTPENLRKVTERD
jgi:hypothetical protein